MWKRLDLVVAVFFFLVMVAFIVWAFMSDHGCIEDGPTSGAGGGVFDKYCGGDYPGEVWE